MIHFPPRLIFCCQVAWYHQHSQFHMLMPTRSEGSKIVATPLSLPCKIKMRYREASVSTSGSQCIPPPPSPPSSPLPPLTGNEEGEGGGGSDPEFVPIPYYHTPTSSHAHNRPIRDLLKVEKFGFYACIYQHYYALCMYTHHNYTNIITVLCDPLPP